MRQRVYCVKLVVSDMDKLFFHLFGGVPVFRRADADGLGHGEMFIIQIRERTFVTDYTTDVAGFVQFERHIFLFAAGSKSDKPRNQYK